VPTDWLLLKCMGSTIWYMQTSITIKLGTDRCVYYSY
jgi:hypothetical protein